MKLSTILQLDIRKDENKPILQEALTSLPFFKDKDIVELEDLEAAIKKMQSKYKICLAYITPGPTDEQYYSFMVKNKGNSELIKTIYGSTIYEGFAKLTIFMYSYIKNNLK